MKQACQPKAACGGKNPEFFGDARSLGSVVPLDKAFIEQEQEWSCRRDPLARPTKQQSCPKTIKYLRAWKGGLSGKLILMGLSSFLLKPVELPQEVGLVNLERNLTSSPLR